MCPFLEKTDPRCATHLTLANISRAFAHCAGQYARCPVYQKAQCECSHDLESAQAAPGLAAILLAS